MILCLFSLTACDIKSAFGFEDRQKTPWIDNTNQTASKEFIASIGKDVDLTDKRNIKNYANGNNYMQGYFRKFIEDFYGVNSNYISMNKNILDELLGLTSDEATDVIGLFAEDEASFNSVFAFKDVNDERVLDELIEIVSKGYGADYPNTKRAYFKHYNKDESVSFVIFGDTDFMQVWSERLESENIDNNA